METANAHGDEAGGCEVTGNVRLERIEGRLLRVERLLGLAAPPDLIRPPAIMPPPLPATAAAPSPAATVEPSERFADLMRRRESARPKREPATPPVPQWEVRSDGPATIDSTPASPAPLPALTYESKAELPVPRASHSAWEQTIGLKLAGWVGAIVLVIGLGLGIRYAYDQGWLGGIPPAMRLTLMYCGGFGLIAAGEIVHRRVNKISATGLFGAGVATLFLVSYAGHGYYQLYQRETAFTLMALSTLIGAGVAMRGRLVSIATLALIGGLLAPLVLQGDSNLLSPFLAYLLMLQVVALVLSWWGGTARWWMLRGLSLAGTSLWLAALLVPQPNPSGAILGFTIVYAVLYQLEVILSTLWRKFEAEELEPTAGVSFSVIVTAMLTGALLWILRDSADAVRGLAVVAISAAALGLDLTLRGRARVLAYGFRTQSTILLLLAVPVAFSGSAITIGWAGVALALAVVGAITNDRPSRIAGVAAWCLALGNLAVWTVNDSTAATARQTWFLLFGEPIAAWTVIGVGLVAVGHAIARLHSERESAIAISGTASALFVLLIVAAVPPLGATGVLLTYAWLLFAVDCVRRAGPSSGRSAHRPEDGSTTLATSGPAPLRRSLALLPQSAAILALAAAKWVVVDTLAARLTPGWSPALYRPLLNPTFLTGVALAASIVGIYRLGRQRFEQLLRSMGPADIVPAALVLFIVTVLIALGLSLEVDRVVMSLSSSIWPREQLKQMSWTILWTFASVAFLGLYARIDPDARARPRWRAAAMAIAGLLAIKFCIFDSLMWWWSSRSIAVAPLINFQIMTAAAVVGGIAVIHLLSRRQASEFTPYRVALAALAVFLWAGTLEIDRLIAAGYFPGTLAWPSWQIRQFAWTAWWTIGVVGFVVAAHMRDATILRRMTMLRTLAFVPIVLAMKYLVIDTLAFRVFTGPAGATVVANLQTFAGAFVFAGLILVRHLLEDVPSATKTRRSAGAAAMILLLWLGSLEIDRAFLRSALGASFADPRLAEQVALSIFWSAFAIGCVAAGFLWRTAGLRYFGLALFAFTLLKVGVVDLRQAETGYRILSFFGLGGLLLGTSVLYGKLSSTVLGKVNAV